MSTAEQFWKNKTIDDMVNLQKIWKQNQRMSYDIQKIIPHLRKTKTITDLACGTGTHIIHLDNIFNFEKVFITDINNLFIFNVLMKTPLTFEGHVCNLNEEIPKESLDTDTILWLGHMQYIIDNQRVTDILNSYKDKTIIIKVPCYKDKEVYINKYSEELHEDYEAKYRTLEWTLEEIKKTFKYVKHERLYPKDIDSKYGSLSYLFIGFNKH